MPIPTGTSSMSSVILTFDFSSVKNGGRCSLVAVGFTVVFFNLFKNRSEERSVGKKFKYGSRTPWSP